MANKVIPNKKQMKKVLRDCIKNLDTLNDNDEITVLIVQYQPNQGYYKCDYHINKDGLDKGDEQ